MHTTKTTASIPIKFCTAIKTTNCPLWVVRTHTEQSKMADGRHLGKIEKSPYLGHGWTYRQEILHADAVWSSWPLRFEYRAPVVALVDWFMRLMFCVHFQKHSLCRITR